MEVTLEKRSGGALLDTVPARGLQAASGFERIKTKLLAGGRADGEAA
jgi:hypothetical protein